MDIRSRFNLPKITLSSAEEVPLASLQNVKTTQNPIKSPTTVFPLGSRANFTVTMAPAGNRTSRSVVMKGIIEEMAWRNEVGRRVIRRVELDAGRYRFEVEVSCSGVHQNEDPQVAMTVRERVQGPAGDTAYLVKVNATYAASTPR
eukprot:GFYU01003458.1.p3 GENE.GFYU01003458.1~~GFYU01003458.1.p3  ORF type:complete len:146 (-),score=20.56 GFYU01003458.1:6-443(-)